MILDFFRVSLQRPRKVRMQEAANALQKLDWSSMKEELDTAVRRMENRPDMMAVY